MRLFFALLFLLIPFQPAHASSMKIAAVVNDRAISVADVDKRMQLIIASSGLPKTDDTRKKLMPQIMKSLIEEEIQFGEADRLEIEVTDEEVQQEFASVAQINNLTADQFRDRLVKSGGSLDSFERQLEARIAWAKVFAANLSRQVKITDLDVDAFIDRKLAHVGKTEYLLSEIFIPIDDPKEEREIKQLARSVVSDIRSKRARFAAVAQQISQAPGAAQGGALGWVQADQLDQRILDVLQVMDPKTTSDPVRSLTGYHIYYLSDTRVLSEDSIPGREDIRRKMATERSERISRNQLNNLRSSAFIEIRL